MSNMDSILWLDDLVNYLKLVLIFALINYTVIASDSGLTSKFDSSSLKLNWEKKAYS